MRTIELTKGQVALVDDEDYENLSKFNWRCRKCTDNLFYASLYLYKDGKSVTIGMHRFIMNVSDRKLVVDHIDHNGLNNQKSNLRVCTVSENAKNSRSRRGSSSIYLGVCVLKIKTLKGFRIRIQAKINNNGKMSYKNN